MNAHRLVKHSHWLNLTNSSLFCHDIALQYFAQTRNQNLNAYYNAKLFLLKTTSNWKFECFSKPHSLKSVFISLKKNFNQSLKSKLAIIFSGWISIHDSVLCIFDSIEKVSNAFLRSRRLFSRWLCCRFNDMWPCSQNLPLLLFLLEPNLWLSRHNNMTQGRSTVT